MLAQQYQAILKQSPLFSSLNKSDLTQIIAKTSFVTLIKEQVLFKEGDLANYFFLLARGRIKLVLASAQGHEKIVRIMTIGDTFAEAIMFLRQNSYPLNAIALENSDVLCINTNCYLNVLQKSPKSCFNIMAQLSQKLHWMVGEINNMKMHDATYRLIHFLLNNAQQTHTLSKVGLSISKLSLASRLSIQPETLSRIFKKLSQKGLLSVHRDYVTLLKPGELKNKLEN